MKAEKCAIRGCKFARWGEATKYCYNHHKELDKKKGKKK